MVDIPDVSVWVPLAAPDHVHHEAALQWWRQDAAPIVAFNRVTSLAFVRHLMNPHIMRHGQASAAEAWRLYQSWRADPRIRFLDDPPHVEARLAQSCALGGFGYQGLTDAYLAAFAQGWECRLVALDRGFRRFEGLDLLLLEP